MRNIDTVLKHVTAAREAIGKASGELRAALTEAEADNKTVAQLIEAEADIEYNMLSAALMLQNALEEVTYLTSELHRQKREHQT
jgi:predicted nuclease of restriction endonuclease-like RecB superfamily